MAVYNELYEPWGEMNWVQLKIVVSKNNAGNYV